MRKLLFKSFRSRKDENLQMRAETFWSHKFLFVKDVIILLPKLGSNNLKLPWITLSTRSLREEHVEWANNNNHDMTLTDSAITANVFFHAGTNM